MVDGHTGDYAMIGGAAGAALATSSGDEGLPVASALASSGEGSRKVSAVIELLCLVSRARGLREPRSSRAQICSAPSSPPVATRLYVGEWAAHLRACGNGMVRAGEEATK